MQRNGKPNNQEELNLANAIAVGELAVVQKLITNENINSILYTHETPLFKSIKFNQLLIFYFLLNHRGLILAPRQGSLCVNMALSLYRIGVNRDDPEFVSNATKMVLGLFKKNNYDPEVWNNNFVFEPIQMDKEIEGKSYPLVDLVDAITEYQNIAESNYIFKLKIQIKLRNKIAKILLEMHEHEYSDKWNYISAKSALKSILRTRSYPTLAFSGYDADFVHALELAVSFYYRQSHKQIITATQAFSACLIIARMNLKACADQSLVSRWLHRAHKIANSAIIEGQKESIEFVTAYVKFIADNVSEHAIAKSNGLSNKLAYFLCINQDSPDARTVLEGATEAKDDLVPLRLVAEYTITNKHVYKDKKNQKAFTGLSALCGFRRVINYKEASDIFTENALEYAKTDKLYTFYSYLLSAISQNKLLAVTSGADEKTKIIQATMKTFATMLPFYSNECSLAYHVEISELLSDYARSSVLPTDKFSVFSMMIEYYIVIANFQVNSASKLNAPQHKQLLNNLFTSICEICLVMRTRNWDFAIKALLRCINTNDNNDVLKIIFQHFDQLAENAKTRDDFGYLYTLIKNAKADAYLNKVSVLDIESLRDAVANLKLLKEKYEAVPDNFIELQVVSNRSELTRYGNNHSIIYRTLGEKSTDSDEKLIAFQTAIEMGDYKLVGTSYITQLIKLTFSHIEKNCIRRSLYLSARLICELTLNKADIIKNYQFTEAMIDLISEKAFQFIGSTANARTISPGVYQELAKWYIHLYEVVVKLSKTKSDWELSNPNIELPEIDIDSVFLVNAEKHNEMISNHVRIGMTQSMDREANFLDLKRRAFEQLTRQWGDSVRLVPILPSGSIVAAIPHVGNGIVNPLSNSPQTNTANNFYKERKEDNTDTINGHSNRQLAC